MKSRWSRIVFLPGVRSYSSEFGERTGITLVQQVRRKNSYNPCSAGSEFRERLVPFSGLRTPAGSELGVRTGPNVGWAGSEFGERTGPNVGWAGS